MNFKRVMMILLAALLLPGLALAQTTSTNFTVNKYFDDGNSDADVTVHIQCFTGLPLNQEQTVNPDKTGAFEVNFIVESFAQDQLDCNIWEEDVDGYTGSYDATTAVAGKAKEDSDGCHFENIGNSNFPSVVDDNQCDITNYPNPVQVLVHKDWVIEGSGGDILDPTYKLTLRCDDRKACVEHSGGVVEEPENGNGGACKIQLTDKGGEHSSADLSYTALVIPDWDGGTNCWVDENVYDSSVEVDNGCEKPFVEVSAGDSGPAYPLHVEIGDADDSNECTITNTVFYEGIPTLSQYGMAIMALLMLGVGFVGFRRFV